MTARGRALCSFALVNTGAWPIWALAAITLIVCGGIMTTAWAYSYRKYDAAIGDQTRQLRTVTVVLAEQIGRAVSSVALTQERIVEYIRAMGVGSPDDFRVMLAGRGVHAVLQHQLGGHSQLSAISLIDADGNLVNSSRIWPTPRASVAVREYFRRMKEEPALRELITEPIRHRDDGVWTAYVARKVVAEDGEFLGLVLGALDFGYFERVFASLALDRADLIALFTSDGTLMARWPRAKRALGRKFPRTETALKDRPAAVLDFRGGIDGVNRMVAAQRLRDYPLFVAAGVAKAAIVAEWRKDSTTVWGLATLACVTSALMLALVMRGLIRLRRQDERERARQRLQLDVALNHISHGLCQFDADGRLVLCNRRFIEMYGLPEGAIGPGTRWEDILQARIEAGTFAGDAQAHRDDLLDHLKTEHPFRRAKTLPDGRVIHVVSTRIPNSGWVSTHEDLSDLHRAKAAHERSQAFLHSIVDNVPVAIVVKDARTLRYVLVNKTAESYLGRSRAQVMGNTSGDIFSPAAAASIAARDLRVLSDGKVFSDELRMETPGRGLLLLHVTRAPIADENGKVRYLVGILDDVTERRAYEGALQQAQKMEAVAGLTGGVAHDFNNLLMVMIGNLDLLAEDLRAEPFHAAKVEIILQAALRGTQLTKQMLAFSRRQALQPRLVKVNGLVGDAVQLLRRTLGERVLVDLRLEPRDFTCTVDDSQLQAAIVNIAVNARDAMPDGGVLSIATRLVSADQTVPGLAVGDYVAIAIADTGQGIAPEVRSRIFEPFFTTKESGKGTGLGLSMVYGFMQQSGGLVAVDSIPAQGSTFTLYLPCAAASARDPEHPTPLAVFHPTNPVILVVDDNDDARRTVVRQVRELGCQAVEAEHGAAALAMLAVRPDIKVVISDVMMPGMDGHALAAAAKNHRPGLKVLLISGLAEPHGGPAALSAPLLSKPFRKHELGAALARLFDEEQEAA
jgi:PAS domain S-box-containing protein